MLLQWKHANSVKHNSYSFFCALFLIIVMICFIVIEWIGNQYACEHAFDVIINGINGNYEKIPSKILNDHLFVFDLAKKGCEFGSSSLCYHYSLCLKALVTDKLSTEKYFPGIVLYCFVFYNLIIIKLIIIDKLNKIWTNRFQLINWHFTFKTKTNVN
jgi:hypothetical protein